MSRGVEGISRSPDSRVFKKRKCAFAALEPLCYKFQSHQVMALRLTVMSPI